MTTLADLLSPLVGRWVTTIQVLHPVEESGRHYTAVDTYRWMPGEKVLLHDVEARMGEPVVSLEVYTQGPDGQIVSRNFDAHGTVSDYQASMKNGVWQVEGASETFASTSIAPDRIEGLWRLKTDGGWVDWMRVSLNRIT